MSEIMATLIEKLENKLGSNLDQPVKFVVEGHPPVIADQTGVRQEDGDAVVTLTADMDTFASILNGDVNPAMAVMSGNVKLDGDMSVAMSLNSLLA